MVSPVGKWTSLQVSIMPEMSAWGRCYSLENLILGPKSQLPMRQRSMILPSVCEAKGRYFGGWSVWHDSRKGPEFIIHKRDWIQSKDAFNSHANEVGVWRSRRFCSSATIIPWSEFVGFLNFRWSFFFLTPSRRLGTRHWSSLLWNFASPWITEFRISGIHPHMDLEWLWRFLVALYYST